MTKLFLLLLLTLPLSSWAQDEATTIQTDAQKGKIFNPYKNHWTVGMNVERMAFPTTFNFKGTKSNINPDDQQLWGGRLALGGELYLGNGVNTTLKVEGYYVGTLFSKVYNGAPEVDENIQYAYTKHTGQVWGFDVSQSVGYMFGMKTKNPIMGEWAYLTVEPFVEAGLGMAWAYNSVNYSHDLDSVNERYKSTVRDNLLNSRLGVGMNLTSNQGYFFSMRVTANQYTATQSRTRGFSYHTGDPATSLNSHKKSKFDPIMVYSIGGGYKF